MDVSGSAALDLSGTVEFKAALPSWIRSVKYVRNHHYVELTDAAGNTIRLVAKSLVKGTCRMCKHEVFVETRMGDMTCPHCQDVVDWTWGKAQLSFVPEEESRFSSLPPPPLDDA